MKFISDLIFSAAKLSIKFHIHQTNVQFFLICLAIQYTNHFYSNFYNLIKIRDRQPYVALTISETNV